MQVGVRYSVSMWFTWQSDALFREWYVFTGYCFLCCWLILHINERIPLLYFVVSYRCPFSNNAYVVLLLLFYVSRYSFIYAITRWYRCDQLKSDTGNNTNTVNNNTPGCTRKKTTCLSKSFTSTAAFIHLIE